MAETQLSWGRSRLPRAEMRAPVVSDLGGGAGPGTESVGRNQCGTCLWQILPTCPGTAGTCSRSQHGWGSCRPLGCSGCTSGLPATRFCEVTPGPFDTP